MSQPQQERLAHLAHYCADAQHGTRARYMVKRCRCMLCRAANSRYETMRAAERRAGRSNGLVPSSRAKSHLQQLNKVGVGLRAVAAASDVARSILQKVKNGTKKQIRSNTESKILAITREAFSDNAHIPATTTKRQLSRLLDEGFTKKRLSQELGYKTRALQVGKLPTITGRNSVRVDQLYRRYMEVEA